MIMYENVIVYVCMSVCGCEREIVCACMCAWICASDCMCMYVCMDVSERLYVHVCACGYACKI